MTDTQQGITVTRFTNQHCVASRYAEVRYRVINILYRKVKMIRYVLPFNSMLVVYFSSGRTILLVT